MDFLIEKEDNLTKRVSRDFPNVNLIFITDLDVIEKIMDKPYLFVDSRIQPTRYPDVFIALESYADYMTLKIEANGYTMRYPI